MRKVILASHGSLAEGMYSAIKMIIGDCKDITVYGLDKYEHPSNIYNAIVHQIIQCPDYEYIILCDINGGSVHNQLMHLMDRKNIYLITGMTLSMVLELELSNDEMDTKELLKKIVESARNNTIIFDYNSVRTRIEKGLEDESLW